MRHPNRNDGRLSRRDVLRGLAAVAATTALPTMPAGAQPADTGGSGDNSDGDANARRRALSKGLQWLEQKQHDDGGFEGGKYGFDPAVTALAGQAFLAEGSTPGRGEYGDALARCVAQVTSAAGESGYITVRHEGRASTMYSHGYATNFLAAAYRASMRDPLRGPVERSVKLLADVQSDEGGWRYSPSKAAGADVSVTACQLLALVSADRSGIDVPPETIDRAVAYLTSCQVEDGGFCYVRGRGGSALPRSAAALAALEAAGRSMHEVLQRGRDYLDAHRPTPDEALRQPHQFYWAYFASQAMCRQANKSHTAWRRLLDGALFSSQGADGSWNDGAIGPAYATAIACYVLGQTSPE
ncbi:MAG: prenyltransferase/squalene oxidase repeat-containing protein [Pirellulaceae bacterium]